MTSIYLKLKAKAIGLISKIKRSLSFNNNTIDTQNKNKHINNNDIELKERVSHYSAVTRSPTASLVVSPRARSPRGIK
ncbi:hypothetical protein VTO58DRAFT_107464 [Aureobasidium pullulans]